MREADRCTKPGELGALLRREGLYSSSLSTWRRQRDAGELAGLGSAKRGRTARPKDARDKRIAELDGETRRLQAKLAQAETVIDIQKKVAALLGIPLMSGPTTILLLDQIGSRVLVAELFEQKARGAEALE